MGEAELLAGYYRYRREIAGKESELAELARGQSPKTLWIGCSDSRVIPEEITDADPGELFVHRNIANIVPPAGTDDTVGAVIEFAVLHLHVERIIVCGHTECGGIGALTGQLSESREPHLARWIEFIRPAAERVAAAQVPEAERSVAIIKANVLIQRENVLTYPCVQAAEAAGRLLVYALLYTLQNGKVLVYNVPRQLWTPLGSAPPRT